VLSANQCTRLVVQQNGATVTNEPFEQSLGFDDTGTSNCGKATTADVAQQKF
jgi:hypothetical protein